jgi:hypothetical protein
MQMTSSTALEAPEVGKGSLASRAKRGDAQALETLFRQFIAPDESVQGASFLGTRGLWGLGIDSYACVTDRRIATIRIGVFGEVEYQDGKTEYLNSAAIYQPSRLLLYLFVAGWTIVTFGIGLLLLPLIVRLFYRYKKSGLVFWVREGIPIYIFSDRKSLVVANRLYRISNSVRFPSYGSASYRSAVQSGAATEQDITPQMDTAQEFPPPVAATRLKEGGTG